jgi:hypothetical protein
MKRNGYEKSVPGGMSMAAASAFGIGRQNGGDEPMEEFPSMR